MADMNGVQRREVMRTDDPFGIPACFYWTVDEVADWIESIGYGKYKENFRSHFINGRKLLTVDACVLPRMGITHFGDILSLGKIISCMHQQTVASTSAAAPPPGARPAPRLRPLMQAAGAPPECLEPWWARPQHRTMVEFVQSKDRLAAARLANRPEFYMAP